MWQLRVLFAGALFLTPVAVCLYANADLMNGSGSNVTGSKSSQIKSHSGQVSSAKRSAPINQDTDITTGSRHDMGEGAANPTDMTPGEESMASAPSSARGSSSSTPFQYAPRGR